MIAQERANFVADGGETLNLDFFVAFNRSVAIRFFFDARLDTRVQRRRIRRLQHVPDEETNERDRRDSERAVAPLKPAADAVLLDTSGIGLDEVVAKLERLVRARIV